MADPEEPAAKKARLEEDYDSTKSVFARQLNAARAYLVRTGKTTIHQKATTPFQGKPNWKVGEFIHNTKMKMKRVPLDTWDPMDREALEGLMADYPDMFVVKSRAPPTKLDDAHYTIKRFFEDGGANIGFHLRIPLLSASPPHNVVNPDWRIGMWLGDNRAKAAFAEKFADIPEVLVRRRVKPEDAHYTIKTFLESGRINVSMRTKKIPLLSSTEPHDVIQEDWGVGKWLDTNRNNESIKEMFAPLITSYPDEFTPSWH